MALTQFGNPFGNPFARQRLTQGIGPTPLGGRRLDQQFGQPPAPMDEVPRPNIPGSVPLGVRGPLPQARPNPTTTESESERYFRAMQAVRGNQPETSAYRELMNQAPDIANYQPSKWRQLGAALTAGGFGAMGKAELGLETGENINYAPYRGAMEQYTPKLEAAKTKATLEQSDIESQLELLSNAYAHGLDYDKYMETQRHNIAAEEGDIRQVEATEEANRIRDVVANQADYDLVETPEGVKAIDKKRIHPPQFFPGQTIAGMNAETAQGQLEVARGNLGVAQTNAQTNQRQAEIADKRANTERNRAATYAAMANELAVNGAEQRRNAAKGVEANLGEAYIADLDNALTEMSADPEFSNFIIYDPNLKIFKPAPGISQEDYDDVMDEADDRIEQFKRSGRGGRRQRYQEPSTGQPRRVTPPRDYLGAAPSGWEEVDQKLIKS